jgi:hypothetical protein
LPPQLREPRLQLAQPPVPPLELQELQQVERLPVRVQVPGQVPPEVQRPAQAHLLIHLGMQFLMAKESSTR